MTQHMNYLVAVTLVAASMALTAPAGAAMKMPAIFGNDMVLQQGLKTPVWGWADPGAEITVNFAGQTRMATAGADGRWRTSLDPMPASVEGRELRVQSNKDAAPKVLTGVLVGEVWMCSGQSNMAWPLKWAANGEAEVGAADFPEIRLFKVAAAATKTPQSDCRGTWRVCQPDATAEFSAVGYFFVRKLHQALGVPIGLIESSWSGTGAQSWTPLEDLNSSPNIADIYRAAVPMLAGLANTAEEYKAQLAAWEELACHRDTGIDPAAQDWSKPDIPAADWADIAVPGPWEVTAKIDADGAFWFRRTVDIPAAWTGKDLTLALGQIADYDVTYFNGQQVGSIVTAHGEALNVFRRHPIAGSLVTAGRATVAVRVFNRFDKGGFISHPDRMLLQAPDGSVPAELPLAGTWQYRAERSLTPKPNAPPPPIAFNSPHVPSVLFNGMIHPLIPYAIRGVIWYQGESNAGQGRQYATLFPTLIEAWREAWGGEPFPFYFVQLANFGRRSAQPENALWPELREAQLQTLTLKNTGMAVTIDIGDADDIHPRNKQDVGLRLAFNALAQTYGQAVPYAGPRLARWQANGNQVVLQFSHTDGGLQVKGGGALKGFAIAGESRHFAWADATVSGDEVVLTSPKVETPVAVRYAWGSNPECNLISGAGLPASPFRTDDWPPPGRK